MVSAPMLYHVKMRILLVPMASVSVTLDSGTLNNVVVKVLQKRHFCILYCNKLMHHE